MNAGRNPDGGRRLAPARKFPLTLWVAAAISIAGLPGRAESVARGPLRVHPGNPRYFTDGSGKAIYLTAAHTWDNLPDIGLSDPPPAFDFDRYLKFLADHNYNYIRLWRWETPKDIEKDGIVRYSAPHPWKRTGPGTAWDGKPKFDLSAFNEEYFSRMRKRVEMAGARGIYVSVMLFNGWELQFSNWSGHPFNAANNSNGIDGDPDKDGRGTEIESWPLPAGVEKLEKAYVRKVIDTVNDLDNVLYEITNEDNGSPEDTAWQYHMIDFIKGYESHKPKQHPAGMTHQWPDGKNAAEFNNPGEWFSPGEEGGFQTDPPTADGSKVVLNDTDHSFFFTGLQKAGLEGQRAWVWKNFTRGNQTLFMDPYIDPTPWYITTRNGPQGRKPDPYWETLRINMGYTHVYADRINLASMTPQCALASTGYCLAGTSPRGAEFLVYLPQGPWLTVDLSNVSGMLAVEWFNPSTGVVTAGEPIAGGKKASLMAPFSGDAVLYLVQTPAGSKTLTGPTSP